MPTRRALAFLIIAVLLYLFANQTQVGWIYIMSALVAGVLPAAWWLNRWAVRGVTVSRAVQPTASQFNDELHEGDELEVALALTNPQRAAARLVRATEFCPFAVDAAPQQLFIPSLAQNQSAQFTYTVTADRRGVHRFPPLPLSSRAPFGLFERKRLVEAPTLVIIYPEVKKLRRLSLLDRQPAAQLITLRVGVGTEIIGVRAYRVGDSPRHIHWRSVARTNRLMSKEFADESNPGLTLVLDTCAYAESNVSDVGRSQRLRIPSKHTPFEYAVKIAASISDYALRCSYPLHLLADESALAVPSGAVNRLAMLEYLARVQPTGQRALADVIHQRSMQTFVAVVMPFPDPTALESLSALSRRAEVMVILLDPESFPVGGVSARSLADDLRGLEIDVRLVRFGEDWQEILTSPLPSLRNSWGGMGEVAL